MTKVTDTDLIEKLKLIDSRFLPFTKWHSPSLEKHFEEFLRLFESEFENYTPVLKVVVPAFYEIIDWDDDWTTDKLREFIWLNYYGAAEEDAINTIYNIQNYVAKKTKKSFSGTVINYLNKHWSGRKTIRISISNEIDEDLVFFEKERLITFFINSNKLSFLREKYLIPQLRFGHNSRIGKLASSNIELDKVSISDFNYMFSSPKIHKNELVKLLVTPVIHHSLYLTQNVDLLYFFSNTVINHNISTFSQEDMGLGGVFALVDQSTTKNEQIFSKFIDIFERLTDKLASRIIHHYRVEESIKQTRKAAISQVMSRNLSHNIGSHVLANLTSGSYLNSLVGHNKEGGYGHIANLNSYLRTRMDFLADISTGTAVVENVKDLREDVTLPFQKIDLLQQHISGSDKKVNIRLPRPGILAAFPNDNLGVQAFYVILENVIRNSAKHGRADKVVIQFDVDREKDDNFIEIIVYDSKDSKSKQNLAELIQRQQERINKPILENGMLRKGSWGVLEMKIAAAYLRKQPVETVDEPQQLPFLTAESVDQQYLGYKFYLLKPKRLLVINEQSNVSYKQQKQLAPYGINVIPLDEIDESQSTYPHEIVVLSKNGKRQIQKKRRRFSPRIVSLPAAELSHLLGKPPEEMISKAWQLWQLTLEGKGASARVTLSDDKSSAPEQTTRTLTIGKAKSGHYQQAEFVYHCDHFHEGLDYFEPYSSLSPIKSLIEELIHSNSMELRCQFLEAIHYKAAVVDERVQSYALRDYNGALNKGHTKNLDILNSCGIVIPGKSINLNANDFSNVEEQELRDWMIQELRRCDFLVLHIGVIEKLERMEQDSDEGKKEVLKKFLDDLSNVSGKRGRLIITSGRGQPETLPRGTRFIHYSNIAQYVIEKTSKFHFLQLLMSAREIN